MDDFKAKLYFELQCAVKRLKDLIQDESLYAIALYTNDHTYYNYICLSANTQEGLLEKAKYYSISDPRYKNDPGVKKLRWSIPDWKYHCFAPNVEDLKFPEVEDEKQSEDYYKVFVSCLKKLRKEDFFKNLTNEPVFLIGCGDLPENYFQKGFKLLNSKEAFDQYLQEYTPRPFLDMLETLPLKKRKLKLLQLYHDLSLGIESTEAVEAKLRNVEKYDLEPLIRRLGMETIDELIKFIDQSGFKPAFYPKGSVEFKKYGAWTLENSFSTACVFLISEFGVIKESQIKKLIKILGKRVQLDKNLAITSTLAENIARILHRFKPHVFPESVLNPKTNHLDNPEKFII